MTVQPEKNKYMVAIFKLIHDDLNNLKLDHVHLLLSLKIIILNYIILLYLKLTKDLSMWICIHC
jgi:hypothetical protein